MPGDSFLTLGGQQTADMSLTEIFLLKLGIEAGIAAIKEEAHAEKEPGGEEPHEAEDEEAVDLVASLAVDFVNEGFEGGVDQLCLGRFDLLMCFD